MNPQVKVLISGVLFAIWPLVLAQSRLKGIVSSAVYGAVALLCMVPFTLANRQDLVNVRWLAIVISGIVGATGLLFFNGGLAEVPEKERGTLFMLMIVVQAISIVGYHIFTNGGLTWEKGIGFVLAIAGAFFLLK